jgi:hypothetical protein
MTPTKTFMTKRSESVKRSRARTGTGGDRGSGERRVVIIRNGTILQVQLYG